MTLPLLIFVGGIMHFGILLASAAVPLVLDWKSSLGKLDHLSRQLVWVHGAFIVLVIAGFGLLSIAQPDALAAGTPLARSVCLFIGLFWLARLGVQFFVFDVRGYLKTALLKVGYHSLTVVFLCITAIYLLAALGPA